VLVGRIPVLDLPKVSVEDGQDGGVGEEVGLVHLSDLDAPVGADVQVDVVAAV
jgi:hypothetical protein